MKYLPSNTLAHFNAAPQVQRLDVSLLPTSVFSAATVKYRESCGQTLPNDDAITFYALNHVASLVRKSFTSNEPLPDWAQHIMAEYTTATMAQGKRMLHYILSITTREMRHLRAPHTSVTAWKAIEKAGGQAMVDFIKDVASNGDEETAVGKYMHYPPQVGVGAFTAGLAAAFRKGSFAGSFGGIPWAEVAEALSSMVHGTTSMEMLVDTGYTLAHNNGPIFNKGMMYLHHTPLLLMILDVQRSGQMPDLLLDPATPPNINKVGAAINGIHLIQNVRPGEFKGWVDWHLVDAMRPEAEKKLDPSKYAQQMAAQLKAHPTLTPAVLKKVTKFIGGKKVKVTGTWEVFPGQSVETYERIGA